MTFTKNYDYLFTFYHDNDSTVWKLRQFVITLSWQKFRETNGFTKYFAQQKKF